MRRISSLALIFAAASLLAQSPAPAFHPLPPIDFDNAGPVIQAHTEALKPFTVAGERGVLVGQQDGTFESWLLPMKLLSHLTLEANVAGYTVPIDVNQQSAQIEVRPDRTVITYAHIAFTVRQIMFSPAGALPGTGPVVLFQFDCVHPTDFTLRFTPELRWMWPERNEGVPGVEWVAPGHDPHEVPGGFYVLHADYPDFAAAVTIPGALPGILAPYQERPQVHPVELKLHIDPARDRGKLFPLLMAYGSTVSESNSGNLAAVLEKLNAAIPSLYKAHADSWRKILADSVSINTPDQALNQAFQWAEVSIEQLKTRTIPGQSQVFDPESGPVLPPLSGTASTPAAGTAKTPVPPTASGHDLSRAEQASSISGASAPAAGTSPETALVAGYYASGDSARPGFGWFFGRDALYTLYAVNGYGDFSLSKSELEFLIRRQRADGKIMHEWSQTAAAIDWRSFPYMYAAADATPLFLLATLDYVRHSGDTAFLTAHRDALEKAWKFETDPAHDTDHDGIYDNSQGTGWVESWPGGMPHQEVYLSLLDRQASDAYAAIERLLGNQAESDAAARRAHDIAAKIETEYYDSQKGCYAFATNPPGSPNGPVDRTTTVYPALAWWSSSSTRKSPLAHGDNCLKQFAAATLNTDWGLRDLSNQEKIYDGMSYHQGSVWPLFTGWAALAEYRGNQPLAGYQMLMENANLTWAQDLGADTELLSGDFFVPFGRSTTHQLWSSAMVVIPTLRGLFGLDIDAQAKTITVNPHLPANWDHAEVKNLRVGSQTVDLTLRQLKSETTVTISNAAPGIKLASADSTSASRSLRIPRRTVDAVAFFRPPAPGDRTQSARVLAESYSAHQLTLSLEGLAGSRIELPLFLSAPAPKLHAEGAVLEAQPLRDAAAGQFPAIAVAFPPGEGWKALTVTLTW